MKCLLSWTVAIAGLVAFTLSLPDPKPGSPWTGVVFGSGQ